jgi:hypothetical protein
MEHRILSPMCMNLFLNDSQVEVLFPCLLIFLIWILERAFASRIDFFFRGKLWRLDGKTKTLRSIDIRLLVKKLVAKK